jgi:N-methylhydantoinase A
MTRGVQRLGIDTGGTFTDFVSLRDGVLAVHKVLSTPAAPERAILTGVSDLRADCVGLEIVHGSTVATNAVLEGKGARTALITNRGFADLLTLGRQTRRALYDLQPPPQFPPVPREWCLETGGRIAATGECLEPLTEADLRVLCERLNELAPEAVAINLLFSFIDDRFERAIEAALPAGLFISRSSAVLPEYREYERGIATWLNATVGPLMQGYLARLAAALPPATVAVMQSNGGTLGAAQAGTLGVQLLLSGPAGGLMGARYVGALAGRERLLTFDMGGTSTDVALIDGTPRLTVEGMIGAYPVAVPMMDIHTLGAGGGSIAWIDAGGLLQVGPQSAGAAPGPACYGQGGEAATVTDANLVLGRLCADAFLGGTMLLDRAAAEAAVDRLATMLGTTREVAAAGVIDIANAQMAQALRLISVERGLDPRGYTLLSFGGAGGLHVCALAEALGMSNALVPVHAGVLSALGMLVAPRARQRSQTMTGPLDGRDAATLAREFATLAAAGHAALQADGVDADRIDVAYSVDLRYQGQSFTFTLPWQDPAATGEAFHAAHAARYGHRLALPIELVNLRIAASGPAPEIQLTPLADRSPATPGEHAKVHACAQPVPVWRREELAAGQRLTGPAIITETVATTWLAPGWRCEVDRYGNLLLERH